MIGQRPAPVARVAWNETLRLFSSVRVIVALIGAGAVVLVAAGSLELPWWPTAAASVLFFSPVLIFGLGGGWLAARRTRDDLLAVVEQFEALLATIFHRAA